MAAQESGNCAAALREFQPLAEQGFPDAQNSLGNMYVIGKGMPQDDAEAVRWYHLAAEQGNAGALFNLGVMYLNGDGVPQDNATAHMWLTLATASGYKDLQGLREKVAGRLSQADQSEGHRRAHECSASDYKDCD